MIRIGVNQHLPLTGYSILIGDIEHRLKLQLSYPCLRLSIPLYFLTAELLSQLFLVIQKNLNYIDQVKKPYQTTKNTRDG